MNRSDIKKTPGRIVFDSMSLYAKLGTHIESTLVSEMFPVGTDAAGELDHRQAEAHYRTTITPDGRITSTIAGKVWPYGNPSIGSGIFTDTDKPLVVHGSDASLETFTAAAVEQMPNLRFSSVESLLGQLGFLCLRGNNMDWDDANSLVTQADSGGSMVDSGFTPGGIVTQPYLADWGAITGFQDFDTIEGFNVEFNITFSDDRTDRQGLVNRRLKTVSARVRCSPIGPTRQQIMTQFQIQGSGAGRGKARTNAADLSIIGEDGLTYFTLKKAILTDKVERWGTEQIRIGDVAWVATRAYSSGSPEALFTFPLA